MRAFSKMGDYRKYVKLALRSYCETDPALPGSTYIHAEDDMAVPDIFQLLAEYL